MSSILLRKSLTVSKFHSIIWRTKSAGSFLNQHDKLFCDYPIITKCIPNGSFLFRRNLRLRSAARFCMIIVLSHIQTTFLLDLCDIQTGHFETVMFKNIFSDFGIGWMNTIHNFFQLQRINFNVDMCVCEFGQCNNRFDVGRENSIDVR